MISSKNKYGQYFTPSVVADFMISLADIRSTAEILEPACGEGIFLELLARKGFQNITAYEVDEQLARKHKGVRYESFVSAKIGGKYDLVIGNPPYIRWKNLEAELKEELANSELWQQYFNSLCDYLYIFILKSIEVLKENGQLIFICPEYWMNTTHAQTLRNYMVQEGYFEKIFHFNETPIFNNAKVSVVVFKYIKSKDKQQKPSIQVAKYFQNKGLSAQVLEEMSQSKAVNSAIRQFEVEPFRLHQAWILAPESEVKNIERFEKACCLPRSPLNSHSSASSLQYSTIGAICHIGNGMVSGLDKAFQLNGESLNRSEQQHTLHVVKAKNLRPFTHKEITPYLFANEVLEEKALKKRFPNFYRKLQPFKDRLAKRYQYNRQIPYWHWVFLRNYALFRSNAPRIFVPCKERISNKDYFRFALVESGFFPTQDVTALFLKEGVKESIYYVLAFLNHPCVFNWLKYKGIVKGSIVEFSEKPLSSIPFRGINWRDRTEVELHQEIVELTQAYIQNRDEGAIYLINRLVERLLTHGL